MTRKKNIDQSGLEQEVSNNSSLLNQKTKLLTSGIGGGALKEAVPNYKNSGGDKEIKGANNTWIVFGRDRPANVYSGYGGKGHTQAGAIDIVVGRLSYKPQENLYVDPDFKQDSARIYISQKTDIDDNFSIVDGSSGNSKARSGIGIKADTIRLVARENIKIVTGTDEKNSQGGDIPAVFGIDLIAGNKDANIDPTSEFNLQPMVKGDNLLKSLEELSGIIEQLSGIVSTFLSSQMDFNSTAAIHYHYSPFFGIPTTPSDLLASKGISVSLKQLNDCILGLTKFKFNINAYKANYLRPFSEKYINSKFNRVN